MVDQLSAAVKVADQVWVVTALLHREHPDRDDFSVGEIMTRARREAIARPLRPSFHVHVIRHCVANRPPSPGRWRMLVETAPGRRRLFRPGDRHDPGREGARTIPEPSAIPEEYRDLLDWFQREYARAAIPPPGADPMLALRGSGRDLWRDESPDAYVERLRGGWA